MPTESKSHAENLMPALLGRVLMGLVVATVTATLFLISVLTHSAALMIAGFVVAGTAASYSLLRFLIRYSRHHEIDIFAPWVAFPIVYVLWFAIGSINFGDLPPNFGNGLFDPIPLRMWVLYGVGLIAYFLGILWIMKVRKASHRATVGSAWNYKTSIFILRSILIGSLALWIIVVALYGVPSLSSDAAEARLALHGPIYQLFIEGAWTSFILLPVLLWVGGADRQMRWRYFSVLALLAVLMSLLAGRANVVIPLITLLIARHYTRAKIAASKAVLLAVSVFVAASVAGYFRDLAFTGSLEWLTLLGIPTPVAPFVYSGLYIRYSVATFRDLVALIPAHAPFQWGALSFSPFRTFMPGRQLMSDEMIKNLLGRSFTGSGEPASLLGPLYADWGVLGISVGMFLFGALCTATYRAMRESRSPLRIVIYAWVMQTAFLSLFACLFPYIGTLLSPLAWLCMNLFMKQKDAPRVVPGP